MEQVVTLGLDRELEAEARVERLVAEHSVKLARFVRRFVNDRETALDLTQDVFFAAYRMLRAQPSRPLTAGWLYKTATNHALSLLRKQRRRGETLPLGEAAAAFRLDERTAESVDLQRALDRLPPEQVACVMLTTYAGYSSNEAALLLNTTPDAVRQRVHRAMRALRGAMVAGA